MGINGLAGIWKTKINLENGIHYMQKNVMPYEKLSHKAKNIGILHVHLEVKVHKYHQEAT